MDVLVHPVAHLRGSIRVPPDKSITQRAVLLAACAHQTTQLAPWSSAQDCQRACELIRTLGVQIEQQGEVLVIQGRGADGLTPPTAPLWCGESATTLRLASGLLAGQPFAATLSGGPSLSRRPMRRITEPLTRMGARIQGAHGDASDPEELYPPLRIHGRRPLQALTYTLPVASAQVKSAILLAGLFAEGPTTVIESVPTRDHTERLLERFGVPVLRRGSAVTVNGGTPLKSPGRLAIPGDLSSAAFFLTAAACRPGSRLEAAEIGLNPTRMRLLDVLQRMGARLTRHLVEEVWEPRGSVQVEGGVLRATRVTPEEVPALIDELPLLMVAACCAQGVTVLQGIGELRKKETDRLHSMMEGLSRLGASITLSGAEELHIAGSRLTGARVESHGDHRTAMALAVAGLLAEGTTRIAGAECVAKSYPDFFDVLARLAGSGVIERLP